MQIKKSNKVVVNRIEKVNSELLTLTYGAIVSQIIKDSDTVIEANEQLEKMGFNIGQRIIDEYLSKAEIKQCRDKNDVAENIGKGAMQMFLGVTAEVEVLPETDKIFTFNLHFTENPLNDFVELPEHLQGLNYSNMIAGAIRGALSTIHWIATCRFLKDQLKNDDKTILQVEMIREKFKDDE
ncbi:unnamed protein product [Paramecium sonneborni]|uniref:Trafficking protein particle complex subunit n=1 Tax=Paramecium sonneborni TaxID=65129 RepID=A0A8S1NQH8_9CILI|nr:unnamed protein product [Paramecium sonneborni]